MSRADELIFEVGLPPDYVLSLPWPRLVRLHERAVKYYQQKAARQ